MTVEYKILPKVISFDIDYNKPIYFGIYKIETRRFLFWKYTRKYNIKDFEHEHDAKKALEIYKNYQ